MINRDAIKLIFILWMTLIVIASQAQNIGINATGATPNTSAGLDVDFTNKGMLVPRVTLTGTGDVATIATPATSLLVYNTATAGVSPNNVTPGFYYWSGTAWTKLAIATNPPNNWTTTGNAGTNSTTNFIGTTDNQDFVFKTNGTEEMRLESGGNLGLNVSNPEDLLHIGDGAGDVFFDKGVSIESRELSWAPHFNIIGYGEGGGNQINIGESTSQVEKINLFIPEYGGALDDGSIEFIAQPLTEPLMLMNEQGRIGIYKSNPEDLLHIGDGAGDVFFDKGVSIESRELSWAPHFNIIGYGEGGGNQINIGESTSQVEKINLFIPEYGGALDDGSIEFIAQPLTEPLMQMNEQGRIGIYNSNPEDLLHIGDGAGDVFFDKGVSIESRELSWAPHFNIIGYGEGGGNQINIGESTSQVEKINLFIPEYGGAPDDGNIEILSSSVASPVMHLNENGKVGVNTSNPAEQLHVNGKVKIGAYTLPDTDGTSNQVLSTNGSGVVSWATQGSSNGWNLTGNAGTTLFTNFIGTTDNVDMVFKRAGIVSGRLSVNNTSFGVDAFDIGSFGNYNTVIGNSAMSGASNGNSNTTIGESSLRANANGNNNSVNGATAMWTNVNGNDNTAMGYSALYKNINGSGNTAIGKNAGGGALSTNGNTNGNNNTYLGFNAGPGTMTQLTNSTAIGYNASVTANNSLVLGGTGADIVNVGIGVTAPSARLEIAGQIKINGGTPGAGKVLVSDATGLASWQTVAGVAGQWMLTGNAGTSAATNFVGTTDAIDFVTRTSNTERTRITSTGNMGIGTAAPLQKLDVVGNVYANTGQFKIFNATNDLYRGNVGKYGAAAGFDFNNLYTNNGIVLENGETESGGFYADGDMTGIWSPGDNDILKIWDEDGMTLRARLDGGGNWYAVTNNVTSDERMKKNIRQLPGSSLEKIMSLNGKIYDWREEIMYKGEIEAGKDVPMDELKNKIGFIAQELELVIPEVVVTNKATGMKAVNYDGIIPVVVEAMKEQQSQIDDLKLKNENLVKEIQEMKRIMLEQLNSDKK